MLRRILIIFMLSIFVASCTGPSPIDWGDSEETTEFERVDSIDVDQPDPAKAVNEMSHQEFIDFIGNMACESMRTTGVPASVTIAQAIQETGWGKSTIQDAKNLFGVKGAGPAGSIEVATTECDRTGACYTTKARFKKYNSFQESIDDHADTFSLPYYQEAMKHKDNPDEFARHITGIYATDPKYGSKLISIMQANDLYAYDTACRD